MKNNATYPLSPTIQPSLADNIYNPLPAPTPKEFTCTITQLGMEDPVIAPNGASFEKYAIEHWLTINPTNPLDSNEKLSADKLIPNHNLKSAIQRWEKKGNNEKDNDTEVAIQIHANSSATAKPEETSTNNNQKTLPEEYICPIAKTVMEDPVVAEDGFSYEKKKIEEHLKANQNSPKTGRKIGATLYQNKYLNNIMIAEGVKREKTEAPKTPTKVPAVIPKPFEPSPCYTYFAFSFASSLALLAGTLGIGVGILAAQKEQLIYDNPALFTIPMMIASFASVATPPIYLYAREQRMNNGQISSQLQYAMWAFCATMALIQPFPTLSLISAYYIYNNASYLHAKITGLYDILTCSFDTKNIIASIKQIPTSSLLLMPCLLISGGLYCFGDPISAAYTALFTATTAGFLAGIEKSVSNTIISSVGFIAFSTLSNTAISIPTFIENCADLLGYETSSISSLNSIVSYNIFSLAGTETPGFIQGTLSSMLAGFACRETYRRSEPLLQAAIS